MQIQQIIRQAKRKLWFIEGEFEYKCMDITLHLFKVLMIVCVALCNDVSGLEVFFQGICKKLILEDRSRF